MTAANTNAISEGQCLQEALFLGSIPTTSEINLWWIMLATNGLTMALLSITISRIAIRKREISWIIQPAEDLGYLTALEKLFILATVCLCFNVILIASNFCLAYFLQVCSPSSAATSDVILLWVITILVDGNTFLVSVVCWINTFRAFTKLPSDTDLDEDLWEEVIMYEVSILCLPLIVVLALPFIVIARGSEACKDWRVVTVAREGWAKCADFLDSFRHWRITQRSPCALFKAWRAKRAQAQANTDVAGEIGQVWFHQTK